MAQSPLNTAQRSAVTTHTPPPLGGKTSSLPLSLSKPSAAPKTSTPTHFVGDAEALVCDSGRVYELGPRLKRTLYGEVRAGFLLAKTDDGFVRTAERVAIKVYPAELLAQLQEEQDSLDALSQDNPLQEIAALHAIRSLSHAPPRREREIVKRRRTQSFALSLAHSLREGESESDAEDDPHNARTQGSSSCLAELLDVQCGAACVCVVQRRAPGEELFSHLAARGAMDERRVARVLRDVLRALCALKTLRLAHRDVSLENVLYDAQRESATLVDLGLSLFVADRERDRETERESRKRGRDGLSLSVSLSAMPNVLCGRAAYLPPETLALLHTAPSHKGKAAPETVCGFARDVWASGVLAAALLCGRAVSAQAALSTPQCERFSAAALQFLRRALCEDERERATAEELLHSEFIRTHCEDERCERELSGASPCSLGGESDCERATAAESETESEEEDEYDFVDASLFQ